MTYVRIAQLQTSALFPSLRHLEYCPNERSSNIFLFLSPLLDSLEIYYFQGLENTVVGPFLVTLSSSPQMLRRIVLRDGRMSVDIFKKSFVHFKQLRSLELSAAVFMTDMSLFEVLGTLPSLESFTLEIYNPESHPAHAPGIPNSQSGALRYFEALENLHVRGSFFLIQHLLYFIDSLCLKSIYVLPFTDCDRNEHEHEPEDLLTPSMTIVASKWLQSLKNLTIDSDDTTHRNSKFLMPLADLHELQTLELVGWRMEKNNDALRCLAISWPKLRSLTINQTYLSLTNLRIIAESCPELRHLYIELDIDTIPPFDEISSKRLCHKLEILDVIGVHKSNRRMLERRLEIQIAQHLDSIFPNLKTINVEDDNLLEIYDLVKLCQDVRRGQ